ncbi:phage tail tape measure protein [Vibrio sp.]|nr:phage tail tape measure protein [Vibrio sp.]
MQNSKQGMRDMVTGGAGLVATGFAIQNALMPAIEMDRKLGEVKSLGVTDDALKTLSQTALEFSSEYGKSATDFVAASYDIQSAIAGLNGDELSQFTKASGVLAAATKADTTTITSYMGTMYGIFENDAQKMGKAEWVERITGMTATAVQMFKTDGSKMSQAFSTLGSSATAMGADVSEQMAVLGTLQATMGGSEAATKYTAFLGGAVTAQKKLGLSFTDSEGRLLPMVDILTKLDGKIGNLGEAKQYAVLKDAFGSEEAVKLIQNLLPKTAQLTKNIDELAKVQDMSKAEQMAAAMTDQWERLEASWFAIRAAAFGAILPAINAVVGSIADGMTWLTEMTDQFPLLTQVMSGLVIVAVSLGGVVASLSLVMGMARMMSAGWSVTLTILKGVLTAVKVVTLGLTKGFLKLGLALLTNPIGWVFLALGAGIALAINYWDELKASFGDLAVFKMLSNVIDWVIDKLNMIPGVDIEWRAGDMPGMPETNAAKTATTGANLPAGIRNVAQIPSQVSEDTSVIGYKQAGTQPQLAPNIVNNMTRSQSQSSHKVSQFGDVYITTKNGFTPDQLTEWEDLNAG